MHEPRTLTLVFHINDQEAFERDHPNIRKLALAEYNKDAPYSVGAMSVGNEVRRAELIDEVLERCKDPYEAIEMIREILTLYEPKEFDNLDWGDIPERWTPTRPKE